jgi:hypothetical protein
MEDFQVRVRVDVDMTFTVEAKNEESAEKKLQKILDKEDVFELIQADKKMQKNLCEKGIVDGPYNDFDIPEIVSVDAGGF